MKSYLLAFGGWKSMFVQMSVDFVILTGMVLFTDIFAILRVPTMNGLEKCRRVWFSKIVQPYRSDLTALLFHMVIGFGGGTPKRALNTELSL